LPLDGSSASASTGDPFTILSVLARLRLCVVVAEVLRLCLLQFGSQIKRGEFVDHTHLYDTFMIVNDDRRFNSFVLLILNCMILL
jgi:hypothetical protein